MAETTKNYIGWSAKEVTTTYGKMINVSLRKADLDKLPVSEKGFIRLTISERKEIGKFGDTHSVFENTYVPKDKPVEASAEPQEELFG